MASENAGFISYKNSNTIMAETVCDDRSMIYATDGYLHVSVDFYSKTEYFLNFHSNIL